MVSPPTPGSSQPAKPFQALDIVKRLRARGHLGGTIQQHRAIWRLRLPWSRVLGSVALAMVLSALMLWLRPWIALAWGTEMVWWMRALDLPGRFEIMDSGAEGLLALPVPLINVQLRAHDAGGALWQGLGVGLLWWCMGWLPDEAKPVAFFVRLAALVHGAAVLFFVFWPASFVHSLNAHVSSGLRQAWYLMLLTPWVHLATYYLFPFAMWQRGLLSLLTMLFLFVLTPLQYALHTALIARFGLIAMPLLHLLFGVMLAIIGFVALYGWAMGWRGPGQVPDAAR